MLINIMTEPSFQNSSWCKAITSGLFKALSKKKLSFSVVTDIPEKPQEEDTCFLILIASDENWLTSAISHCRDRKIHPIVLGSEPRHSMPGAYSSVTSDIRQSMYYLVTRLKKLNKTRPALYGINPESLQDTTRKKSFLEFTSGDITDADIFYNNGSLKECFNNFKQVFKKYDCVICANDYAAISLLKNLDNNNIASNSLFPVSYGGTLLASRYSNRLLTISMNYEEYGKAAISICETIHKNPAILYLNIAIKWKIATSDNSAAEPPLDESFLVDSFGNITADSLFYSDNEMCEMILTENMLSACDKIDFTIISMLLKNMSYETIAEACYISVNTVKYRLKKLMDICNIKTKKEFVELLKKYY